MLHHILAIVILSMIGVALISLSGLYRLASDDQESSEWSSRFETMSNLTCSFGLSAWASIGMALLTNSINLDIISVLYIILVIVISFVSIVRDSPHLE